jgi:NitT/TauT family transport system substrate-binding protein
MQKVIIKFLLVLSVILNLTGCFSEKRTIKIGTNSWPPCEIWQIAKENGYFGKTDVEIIRFSTWSDNMSSLYKGNIDITHSTYFNAVYYYDKGQDAKIILSSDTIIGSDGLVIKDGISSISDLKGKKIAVEINTDEHFLLKKALDEGGIKEKEVTIVSTTSAQAAQMFIDNDVDACFTYEPFLSQAAIDGTGKIVWTTEELQGYMIDVLVASKDVLDLQKKDVNNIISAWYKAQDYIKKNPKESYDIMGKMESMEPKYFGPFYESFTFFDKDENINIFNSLDFVAKLEEMNEFLFSHDAINEKANVRDLFTDEVVKKIK